MKGMRDIEGLVKCTLEHREWWVLPTVFAEMEKWVGRHIHALRWSEESPLWLELGGKNQGALPDAEKITFFPAHET